MSAPLATVPGHATPHAPPRLTTACGPGVIARQVRIEDFRAGFSLGGVKLGPQQVRLQRWGMNVHSAGHSGAPSHTQDEEPLSIGGSPPGALVSLTAAMPVEPNGRFGNWSYSTPGTLSTKDVTSAVRSVFEPTMRFNKAVA